MEESNLWAELTVRELREHADTYTGTGMTGWTRQEGWVPSVGCRINGHDSLGVAIESSRDREMSAVGCEIDGHKV